MDVLPDHLIYEILLLTPVKSLLRFRSLARQWRDTISSQKFAIDHLKCHKRRKLSHYVISCSYSTPSITMYPDEGDPFKLDLPVSDTDGKGQFVIRSSCRGLLYVTFSTEFSTSVVLWNPVTRQCREIFKSRSAGTAGAGNRPASFALGFDPTANDYKIIKMESTRDIHKPNRKIKVLWVKSNVWRELEDQSQYMPVQRAVAIDGYIFWLAKGIQNTHCILKFILACDQLTPIPCPPQADVKNSPHDRINLSLHECGGSIRLVRFELDESIQWKIKMIWLLSTADGTWTDISSNYKAANHQSFRGWDGPLGFTSEAAIVIERRADCIAKEDGVERRGVLPLFKDAHHVLHCESLVSPWH